MKHGVFASPDPRSATSVTLPHPTGNGRHTSRHIIGLLACKLMNFIIYNYSHWWKLQTIMTNGSSRIKWNPKLSHAIMIGHIGYAPINISPDYPPHGEGWGFGGDWQFILANAPALGHIWVAIISVLVCFSSLPVPDNELMPLSWNKLILMANIGKSPMLPPIHPVRGGGVGDYIDSCIISLFYGWKPLQCHFLYYMIHAINDLVISTTTSAVLRQQCG